MCGKTKNIKAIESISRDEGAKKYRYRCEWFKRKRKY